MINKFCHRVAIWQFKTPEICHGEKQVKKKTDLPFNAP
jgi:hypothetical protein